MKEIKLRGHHIEFLVTKVLSDRSSDSEQIKNTYEHYANMYGSEYVLALKDLETKIKPEMLVEIVEGNDDLCGLLKCPYLKECGKGDYKAMARKMMKMVPEFLSSLPILISRTVTKERVFEEDAALVKEYDLEVGDVRPLEYFIKIREKEWAESENSIFNGKA